MQVTHSDIRNRAALDEERMERTSMSRVVVLIAATAASVSLLHAGKTLADPVTPARPVLAQKQLVSGTNCQTAAHAAARPDFPSKTTEYRRDVLVTTSYCSATAHNQLTPAKPEIVVVGPDSGASGGDRVFVRTVPSQDVKKLHDVCDLAGKAAFTYGQTPNTAPQGNAVVSGADVLTASGKVDCGDFLRATDAANPLVVLAPGVISGSVVSVHILNMIGFKKPATEVQAAVDDLGRRVAGSVAKSGVEMRKQPQIVLESSGAN
jgi:hypothetical protein